MRQVWPLARSRIYLEDGDRGELPAAEHVGSVYLIAFDREKIAISMGYRGAWRDNVVAEFLWCSIIFEEV